MTATWINFVEALGKSERSSEVTTLVVGISEPAITSETPDEYDDPLGKTKYYKFLKTGLEFGFRQEQLNNIKFYFQSHEGYEKYNGPMICGIESNWNEAKVVQSLGTPYKRGGGNPDVLIGYIHKWIKYKKECYSIRFEFGQNENLHKVSLML
jgi:filamentous hemagglutinin